VPRTDKEEQLQLRESIETAVRRLVSADLLGVSWSNELVVRQTLASKDVRTVAEDTSSGKDQ
jgi:hypothetical protein